MERNEIRGQVRAVAFCSELEKIAVSPGQLVERFRATEALRAAAQPDLLQKLRPGTGSFFQAVGERARGAMRAWKTRKDAVKGLDQMAGSVNLGAAKNIHEEQDMLRRLGEIRSAERALHGPGLTGRSHAPQPNSWREGANNVQAGLRRAALGVGTNVAFGAGLGAAGILGAQHYLNSGDQGY